MFECRSCVIHAARPVSPIPFLDICNPVYIYIPLTNVFETTSHDSPFAFSVPSEETSIRVHCLVLDLRFPCNLSFPAKSREEPIMINFFNELQSVN